MAYKSIFTVVTNVADVPLQLGAAIDFARAMDAHLDVLCLGFDRTQTGYYYMGAAPMAPVILQESLDQASDEAKATEAAVRQRLAAEDVRWSADTAIAQVGAAGRELALRARFADLVILLKPYANGSSGDKEEVVEAAMFDGHAPVLMLPGGPQEVALTPRRVMIAWNQSNEAMTAVRAALPILKAAAEVNIAVVAPPAHGPERSDPGGLLSQYLARHGVRSEISVLAKTLPHVSEVLNRQAEDWNADLMVMGAYGHSRFREAILGGTTREMFESVRIPLLVAH